MLKRPIVSMTACVLFMLIAMSPLRSREPDGEEKFTGSPPPKEMRVLAARVGNWTTRFVVKPVEGEKEGITDVGECTGKIIHNGHHLRIEGHSTSKRGRIEYTSLYSYDGNRNVYRWWYFNSDGTAAEHTGTWDGKTRTMTWKAVGVPPDQTWVIKDTIGKDRVSATILGKKDGMVQLDASYVAVPKK